MANRNRTHPVQFYLSDDEQYILNTKFKASGMKSMSAFLRKLILYGYVYDVDYSYLRNYNTELGRISSNLNQIAKRVNSTGTGSCNCGSHPQTACLHPTAQKSRHYPYGSGHLTCQAAPAMLSSIFPSA